LLNLDTRELINIIQSLRRDNRRYKLTLSYFDRTSKDLAENRDAVVTVLNFIDNIAATQTSLNNLTVNSIATTAKESNIDKDWQKLLTNNKVTRDWWNSDKPRRPQKHNTGTVNTGTQVHSPHTQHTPTLTLTHNLQTPPLNTVTQVHSPDTQSTPTQTLTPNLQAPALNTLNTITQVHSPHTCSTSTQPLTSNIQPPSRNSSNNIKPNTPLAPLHTNTHNLQDTSKSNTNLTLPPPTKTGGTPATPPSNSTNQITVTNTNTHTSQSQSITTNNVGCQTQSPTDTHTSTRPIITQNQKQDKHKSHQTNPGQPSAAAKGDNPPRPTNTLTRKTYHFTNTNHNSHATHKPPPLLPTPSHLPQDNRKSQRKYCYHCNKIGHTDNTCRWLTWCDFCNREGHSVQNCRSLRAQEQNQTLSHQLTVLVDTLSRHLNQSTGLQTNIGDLNHSYIIPHNPDIIATVETFLNPSIPNNFGKIKGYSAWHRRDRVHNTFGGIAVCFRDGLAVMALDINMEEHLELSFFKLWTRNMDTILLCVCYRPQWQGSDPINFIYGNLDSLLLQHSCKHFIMLGDLNQHLVERSFQELLTDYGLTNYVDFPTHISGSSLDPVITDLPEGVITCRPLGMVGSSDHTVVFTTITTSVERDKPVDRINWLWNRGVSQLVHTWYPETPLR
ncbi:hypothetical protein Pcinc_041267, partial [Petrolisthes cinctipes]